MDGRNLMDFKNRIFLKKSSRSKTYKCFWADLNCEVLFSKDELWFSKSAIFLLRIASSLSLFELSIDLRQLLFSNWEIRSVWLLTMRFACSNFGETSILNIVKEKEGWIFGRCQDSCHL